MNKKAIYIIVAVLVVVIVAAGAGILLLNNNNPNTNSGSQKVDFSKATSLAFNVNDTSQGVTTIYQFKAANIGTNNLQLRVDVPGCDTGINFTYLFDYGTQSAWNSTNNGPYIADSFANTWSLWNSIYSGYLTKLETLSSTAPYSYTQSNGDPTVIYDIAYNPSLPSSTFQTSGTSTASVADATSLQFSANATSSGTTTTLNFAGENLQTSNKTIKVDLPAYGQSYILNYGTQQSWSSTDSGKTWTLDSSFTNDNNIWGARWNGEVAALKNWNGVGNYSYNDTSTGTPTSVTIYNIQVNPSIPASTFATS